MAAADAPSCPADPDGDNRWMDLHEGFVHETKNEEPEVLFVGDSHIALLGQSQVYKELFAPLHCCCFGILGDTTANVLWRLQNGELENIKPKVVILLVGANNRHKADETLAGIRACVDTIRSKLSRSSVFVLKIPPRGKHPNKLRELYSQINSGLADAVAHVENCHVLDIDPGFVASVGTIDTGDVFDYLHLSNEGYKKAFETVYLAIQTITSPE